MDSTEVREWARAQGIEVKRPRAGARRSGGEVQDRYRTVASGTFPVGGLRHSNTCRNEYLIRTHIYAQSGILTHAFSTLPAIAVEPFPSF